MANYASITLIGHLGKDPVTKSLSDGQTVTSFSLATSRKRKDQEITTWWNCGLFGKRGEALARYLKKGDPVLVHGEPFLRKYQSSDGSDGVSLDVACSDFAFIGGKGDSAPRSDDSSRESRPAPSQAPRPAPAAPYGGGFDDDIPFTSCMKHHEYLV